MTVVSATTTLWVSDGSEGLASRLRRHLEGLDWMVCGQPAECDVVIWLASADVDARARRRQSATEGVTAALAAAVRAEHLVLVSSAMVYGAWANNPVPLTEDAVLRPEVEFVYARQLGSVEQIADEWRLGAPNRTVTMLATGAGHGRRWHERVGGSSRRRHGAALR